jgi:hypothetical protein
MKTFAIEVNGILRDFMKKFQTYYQIEFADRDVKEPIDPFNLLLSFEFKDNELEDFIFQYSYELFGKSTLPPKNVIMEINQLYPELKTQDYRVVIISRETVKMRTLTAFYISNFSASFYFDEIRFYGTNNEYVNEKFDYILTANSGLLDLPFENTKVILFDPENKNPDNKNRITNIIEVFKVLENDK